MKKTTASHIIFASIALALAGCFAPQDAMHPQFGKEVWVAVAAISGTKDPAINGAAIGHVFLDKTFVQTIQLNIDPAPAGKEYGAWLVNAQGSDRIFLGVLKSATNDVRHALAYKGTDDPRGYPTLLVTLQDTGKHAVPGPEVARGTADVSKDIKE